MQEKLDKSRNSTKSLKDIEILEIDELCTYIKKDQRMEESSPLYGLLLVEDRVKLLILKVGDRSKTTYLNLGLKNVKKLSIYVQMIIAFMEYYKISTHHHKTKAETSLENF